MRTQSPLLSVMGQRYHKHSKCKTYSYLGETKAYANIKKV